MEVVWTTARLTRVIPVSQETSGKAARTMKFVHLTDQSSLSKIRTTGIHMTKGRLGRGVYAVPLFFCTREGIPAVIPSDDPEKDPPRVTVETSVPLTSATLWKWWTQQRTNRSGNRHVAAIVFRIPSDLWPVQLNIHVWHDPFQFEARSQRGEPFFPEILEGLGFKPKLVMDGAAQSYRMDIVSEKELGRMLEVVLSANWRAEDKASQDLEVLIRGRIPPKHIERIVPLYRTNKEFRKRKEEKT